MDLIFQFLKSDYEDVEDEELSDTEDEDLENDEYDDEEDDFEDDDDESDDERVGRNILWDLVPNIPERTRANLLTALAVVAMVAITFHYNDRHQLQVLAYVTDKERLETEGEHCRSTISHVTQQIDEYADRLDRSDELLTRNEDVLYGLELEKQHLQLLVESADKELGRRGERLEALKAELDLLRLEDNGSRCKLEKLRNDWRSGGKLQELVVEKVGKKGRKLD